MLARVTVFGVVPLSDGRLWSSNRGSIIEGVDSKRRQGQPRSTDHPSGQAVKTVRVPPTVRSDHARLDEPDLVLSASEIGTFAFCEEAWLLQRAGAVRGADGARRLVEGTLAHRRIGRQTDRVRGADRMQRIVLLVILVLVLVIAFEWVDAFHVVRP